MGIIYEYTIYRISACCINFQVVESASYFVCNHIELDLMLHGSMLNDALKELGRKKAFKCTVIFGSQCLSRKEWFETFANTCPQLSQEILSLMFLLCGGCAVLTGYCAPLTLEYQLYTLGGNSFLVYICLCGPKKLGKVS